MTDTKYEADRLIPGDNFTCVIPKSGQCGGQCLWFSNDINQMLACVFLRLKEVGTSKKTQIQLKTITVECLKKLGTKGETYEDIILRLISEVEAGLQE